MKASEFEFKSQYKKSVVKKIKEYRKKGATFNEIAKTLNKKNYDTFSGNGEWYAQSVHRLCK